MKKALIVIDFQNIKNSMDLLEAARQIYPNMPMETYGVSIGENKERLEGVFDYWIGIDVVEGYDITNATNCIVELQQIYGFDCILIPATYFGRMLAPRLAMGLHGGLVADVTSIGHTGDVVELIRPAFDGKILASIVCKNDKPIMASVRENVFSYTASEQKNTIVLEFIPQTLQKRKIQLLSTKEKAAPQDIRECKVLVSGGGGVAHDFQAISSLAEVLGGMVSASRKIVDSGMARRTIQVGQSGKTVSPKLYVALGIYGSLQHVEGLKNVEHIISVNIDKDAPICSLSDIIVEGDALDFVEKLVARIQQDL